MSLSIHENLALVDQLHKNPNLDHDPLLSIVRAIRQGGNASIVSSLNEAKQLIDEAGLKHAYNYAVGRWELVTNTNEFINAREA